jgi:hypothetical protein
MIGGRRVTGRNAAESLNIHRRQLLRPGIVDALPDVSFGHPAAAPVQHAGVSFAPSMNRGPGVHVPSTPQVRHRVVVRLLPADAGVPFEHIQVAEQSVRSRRFRHELDRLLRLPVERLAAARSRSCPVGRINVDAAAARIVQTNGAVNDPHRVVRVLVARRIELEPLDASGEPIPGKERDAVPLGGICLPPERLAHMCRRSAVPGLSEAECDHEIVVLDGPGELGLHHSGAPGIDGAGDGIAVHGFGEWRRASPERLHPDAGSDVVERELERARLLRWNSRPC